VKITKTQLKQIVKEELILEQSAQQILSLLSQMKMGLIKMIAKGLKNPVATTKMVAYYATNPEALSALLEYMAKKLAREFPEPPDQKEIIQYINKNTAALIKLGVQHYNSSTGADIKLKERANI